MNVNYTNTGLLPSYKDPIYENNEQTKTNEEYKSAIESIIENINGSSNQISCDHLSELLEDKYLNEVDNFVCVQDRIIKFINANNNCPEQLVRAAAKFFYFCIRENYETNEIKDFFNRPYNITYNSKILLVTLSIIAKELEQALKFEDDKPSLARSIRSELNFFIKLVENSKCIFHIIQMDVEEIYKYCGNNEVMLLTAELKYSDRAVNNIIGTINYDTGIDDKGRSILVILHPFIRNFAPKFAKIGLSDWHRIFWPLFDKGVKLNNFMINQDIADNFICKLIDIKSFINSHGLNVRRTGTKTFFENITLVLEQRIKVESNKKINCILTEYTENLKLLRTNLDNNFPKDIKEIDFSLITQQKLKEWMSF